MVDMVDMVSTTIYSLDTVDMVSTTIYSLDTVDTVSEYNNLFTGYGGYGN